MISDISGTILCRKPVMGTNGITLVAALLCFCWIVHLPSVELAPSDLKEYVYGLCNTAKFASNSSFATNLNSVIGLLVRYSSSSLFHNATVISNPASTSDNAYGFYQCRGDVSLADCSSCVSSIIYSAVCASALGSRVQLQGCFVRYESYNFFLEPDHVFITSPCSANSSTRTVSFRANLASVLNSTAQAASSRELFDSSSRGIGNDTAYALAQCLGYLSPSQCATCLQVSDYESLCPNAVAGATYFSTCYYLYSNVPFNSSSNSSIGMTPEPAAAPSQQNGSPQSALPISPLAAPSPKNGSSPPASSISSVGGVPTSQENRKKQVKTIAIVGALAGAILSVLVCFMLVFVIRRRRISSRHGSEVKTDGISNLTDIRSHKPRKFSLNELRKATDNFNSGNMLGGGGFGQVYKGTLPDGFEVAVKTLFANSDKKTEQFCNEVNLITAVEHRNLVQLIGYCIDDSERILVYEYLPNRSLDVHLFEGGGNETQSLDWRKRVGIIIGVARGLQYLHEDYHVKIVHRDIKAGNVLLGNDLNPKIADFGLARFFENDMTHLTSRVAGTRGYVSPEYAIGGHLTEKVDVYSFGLLVLEIVSGRRVMEEHLEPEEQILLEWAWTLHEKQKPWQLLDSKLVNQPVDPKEVVRMVHIALLCTQTYPRARPTMSRVLAMLCGPSEILDFPSKPLCMKDFDRIPGGSNSLSSSNPPSQLPVFKGVSNTNLDP